MSVNLLMMKRGLAKMSPEAKAREEIDKKLVINKRYNRTILFVKEIFRTGGVVSI